MNDCAGVLLEKLLRFLSGRAHEDEVQKLLKEFGAVEELFEERVWDIGDVHLREAAFELKTGALMGDLVDGDALLIELEIDLESLDGFTAHLLRDVGSDQKDIKGRDCGLSEHRWVPGWL